MSSHKATDAETSSPSASTAKELVQGLMHLIMETSREMATAPVRCDDDETDIEKHADRIQDLDNRLVSQALEVWLAHDGNIDLRTFFPAQYKKSDSATEHHPDADTQHTKGHAKAPAEPTDTTTTSIIGNTSLFPRTNQLVYETTSLFTFYAWLSKTLPRLPPELVFLVAHTSLFHGTSSTSSASVPAIPSLFSYYLPHLYPYPGPCTAHIPNCRGCCTLIADDDDDEDPEPHHHHHHHHPPPPNANQPSARQAARKQRRPPCSTITTTTSNPSSSSSSSSPPLLLLPHRSPYAPVSAPALRGIWSYAQTASTPIRATNAFAPCSAAACEPEWFAPPPAAGAVGTVYDDEAGVWRCGCRVVLMGYGMGPPVAAGGGGQQWWTDGKERPGKLLWNAWKRGWECGEVERFDPGCCEDQYDSGEEREWDERQEKGREGKKRAGMRWAGRCERCRRRRVEEGEED